MKSKYRLALLSALGQVNALLSAGEPGDAFDRHAMLETLDLLEQSVASARQHLTDQAEVSNAAR